MSSQQYRIDEVDRRLISALRARPRATNSDLARSTGLARGTVQLRLARLVDRGVIIGFGPELDAVAADTPVTSFTAVSIRQGALEPVVAGLRALPEVLEVHVTTGAGDLLCRIAARSNDHLHEVIQSLVQVDGVVRTDSQLVLASPVQRTLADLIGSADD